jgi:hypothetical protein
MNFSATQVIRLLHGPTQIKRIIVSLDQGEAKGLGMGGFKGLPHPQLTAVNVVLCETFKIFSVKVGY